MRRGASLVVKGLGRFRLAQLTTTTNKEALI